METFNNPARVLTLTAPTGGVVSGTAYLIGSLLAVALETVAQTLPFDAVVEGVVDLPQADVGFSEGEKVYWDDSAKKVTDIAGGNTLVGTAQGPIVPNVVGLASNALGADLLIAGLTLQVLDFAQLDSDNATVTVTVNGVPTVLTEEVEFNAVTSDEVTATNLAAAINALAGVSAAAVGDLVTVVPSTGISVGVATGRVRLDGAAR